VVEELAPELVLLDEKGVLLLVRFMRVSQRSPLSNAGKRRRSGRTFAVFWRVEGGLPGYAISA
jgi:hypothetical protein